MNTAFWRRRRVLVTGHTGFKGSWLSLWLQQLEAIVAGYSLPPVSPENLFELAGVDTGMESIYADIRDRARLSQMFSRFQPEIVFHLAAQPLVRKSYAEPVETYETNVMGTVHILEAARLSSSCRVVVNVTSDKCYANQEWAWAYRENDAMGGFDPYSSSKGCSELVTAAYRRSFCEGENSRSVALASARAGNVIGGGDFSQDRLIPDILAAARSRTVLNIRNPNAIRPWQHVLEPLSGYLNLAEKLWHHPSSYSEAWNFGPAPEDSRPVEWVLQRLLHYWGEPVGWIGVGSKLHEAQLLMLDSTKARTRLDWHPRWSLDSALRAVADWYCAYLSGSSPRDVTLRQLAEYARGDAREPNLEPASEFIRPKDRV